MIRNFINIVTKETELPSCVGIWKNLTWNNSRKLLKDLGWRIAPELPAIMEGFERLSIQYVDGNESDTAQAIYTDTLIQDRLDEENEENEEDETIQTLSIEELESTSSESLEDK
jgi:hypothetical protein